MMQSRLDYMRGDRYGAKSTTTPQKFSHYYRCKHKRCHIYPQSMKFITVRGLFNCRLSEEMMVVKWHIYFWLMFKTLCHVYPPLYSSAQLVWKSSLIRTNNPSVKRPSWFSVNTDTKTVNSLWVSEPLQTRDPWDHLWNPVSTDL